MLGTHYTHGVIVRTDIKIDDGSLEAAMALTEPTTKKAAIEEALQRLMQSERRLAAIADRAGLGWNGDLDAMREGRVFGQPT